MDRYGIHRDCPIIWAEEWPHWNAKGWRFECNFRVSCHSGNHMTRYLIRGVQRCYGELNVAFGSPMGDNGPFVADDWIGIYVHDVDSLVDRLHEWMNEWGR